MPPVVRRGLLALTVLFFVAGGVLFTTRLLLAGPGDGSKQPVPPPLQNRPTPVPRPKEGSALSLEAARQELSKNSDLARIITAAESGDITAIIGMAHSADDMYCRSFKELPPGCKTQDDRVAAVYIDDGHHTPRSKDEVAQWLSELYAENPAKMTFACRDSRLDEGDGGKYYLLFTASRTVRVGGIDVGGLALIVVPGSPQPIEIFTFTNPGALGLAWVQDITEAQNLVLITPESVKDWPGMWGQKGQ